ncbi:AAA family ATPase [Leptolyngbya sp. PCC 6406]|uniref:bifunctional aminoglycoside phosphotransferase/ATP-binding protein n=1 Tax=Leptolyngbya sp. PCC 6406 TaxID=1173264 RepID=UPI0002AC4AF1|nr:bifunctional aminoglycoside phosphotransferase/ATP-binding protein [Leptolyngbya sp. PCC 6406]
MADPSLPPLIEQMLEPGFYPHPVAAPLRLIQTHVSYVVLTGDYAYKVKKPVNFGFLDYSTLDLRSHFCQEELRLNQRTAADLYLAVLPITQTGDRYQLKGDGDPVEYAVQMRQFPQTALLSQMFEQGDLGEDLVRQLATTIANFHQAAETDDEIRSYGTVAQVRQSIDENYEQTLGFIGGPQTQAQFDATQAYTDHFFTEQADLLQQRIAGDWIRACHGDLHLNNICYWQNRLWLFDCIEFNKPFRFVDVMFDIAYLVMDFTAQDRPDLVSAFVSEYVERTGDWEGLQVLPLYVSRQSYVRAKVTSFLLGDAAIPEAEKQAAAAKAARYYTLAHDYVQPRQGRLFLMAGLSGAGKSTVARALSSEVGAIHIRSDAVRKHLGGVPLHQQGPEGLYTPAMTQRTYDRLLHLGITLARQGYTVVLDAKYDRAQPRDAAIAQAQAHDLPLDIVYCTAPQSVLRQRVQARTGDIADATVAVLARQALEPFGPEVEPYVTTVDTTQSLKPQLISMIGGN